MWNTLRRQFTIWLLLALYGKSQIIRFVEWHDLDLNVTQYSYYYVTRPAKWSWSREFDHFCVSHSRGGITIFNIPQWGVRVRFAVNSLYSKDLCCLWKLLGDSCILIHSLDGSVVKVSIPSVVMGKDSSEKTVVQKPQVSEHFDEVELFKS